jgi:hypothetical protein
MSAAVNNFLDGLGIEVMTEEAISRELAHIEKQLEGVPERIEQQFRDSLIQRWIDLKVNIR